ncbi:uncharacterized protein [Montipora foliosa]|uniref:uncharacterized protein n=1 Tax=Montipora foliosa TaxID=591990 RepID=UPI0035F1FA93
MAACADGTSSEEFLSDVTSENECNFYDSDVGETSVASMDVGPHPYRFKPCRIRRNVKCERINNHKEQTESATNHLGNTDRCQCGMCQPMPTVHKSVCCGEIGQIWQKVEDQRPDVQMSCITEHLGFQSNCLDVWVLETAYYAYRQQHGQDNHTAHEKFRYIAYRQLVRWCWGYLGKNVRVALPSCVVNKIRSTFSADFGSSYTGLKPPYL